MSGPSADEGRAGGPAVAFEATDAGLAGVDAVEGFRYELAMATPVAPAPVDAGTFAYPVDAAVEVHTDHVSVAGDVPAAYVRDADWSMLAETDPPTERTFPDGEYYVEICSPVKLFLHVEGPLTVEATTGGKRFEFGGERPVAVGGFAKADRPAATVTTTGEPRDVMAAVSTFGAALKTTSPERSFPNQRGHPPAVELGDELAVPDGLAPPDTGVRVEVPPALRYVYPVAPLAHYLGARVVPGDRPRLVGDAGLDHDLAPDGRFERTVAGVLKRTFLLDCVVRTEGLYDLPLAERRALEPELALDPAALYDRPLAERLAAYLTVPEDVLAPAMPTWRLVADVEPTPGSVEALPFLVDDLAVVRADPARRPAGEAGRDAAAETGPDADAVGSLVRSSATASPPSPPSTVDRPAADAVEHAWVGEGVLAGASKAMPVAYRNRLERGPPEGDVDVVVVCNDRAMLRESDVVEDVYGREATPPVEVTVREDLPTAALRDVLTGDADFLHYVGHVDDRGFRCADGWLDAATLGSTAVGTFLLNACSSYEQGAALVEAGAVGGVVTLAEVAEASAVRVGPTLARLLDAGYPLGPAMEIARGASHAGDDYLVVGDGGAVAVEGAAYNPLLREVWRDDDGFRLRVYSYGGVLAGMGQVQVLNHEADDCYHLASGELDTFRLDRASLASYLRLDEMPVLVDGELRWPGGLDLEEL